MKIIANVNRQQILSTLLKNIAHLSDEKYQKRVWIEARGPECDSFDELVTYFFDESESIQNGYKEFGITENQRDLLRKFHEKLQSFSDKNDFPQKFISTPEWKKIMQMAKEILVAFNYQEKKP